MKVDIVELRRRVSLLEEDAKGEKSVSRHILRKLSDNERALLDLRGEVNEVRKEVNDARQDVGELRKDLNDLRDEFMLLRADLPGIIAASISPFFKK